METEKNDLLIDEHQSILLIREMIAVSRKRLENDGILLIVWGWLLFLVNLSGYIEQKTVILYPFNRIMDYTGLVLAAMALLFTIYYLIKRDKMATTYIGVSLRHVWISAFICLVLVNLIQFNVLESINFTLQHPLFMVIMAFAIVTTGGILRYKLITFGGIFFGIMALLSSYMALPEQLLLESFAWLAAFIVPGHYLYAKRKK